jgi:Phage ABA sandwich domain
MNQTNTEIAAGRELDALIAEKVMGLTLDWHHAKILAIVDLPESVVSNNGRGVFCRCSGCDLNGYGNEVMWEVRCPTPLCPRYSTGLTAAWKVVEHLIKQGYTPDMGWDNVNWIVTLPKGDYITGIGACDPSLPVAICRAALRAVEAR